MGAIVVQPQPDDFAQQLMALFAQSDARAAERKRLEQQGSQFAQTFDLEKQRIAAQIASEATQADANKAIANKTNYDVNSARADHAAAPYMKYIDRMIADGRPPDSIAAYASRASEHSKNPEVTMRLAGYLIERDVLPSDMTNAHMAQIKEETTGRVADGGQNAIDVNLATKLMTADQLSAPAFGNQDTREFGMKPLQEAVSIADDRTAGATPRLASATQIQVGREQNASAERIAAARAAAEGGGGSGIPVASKGLTGGDLLKTLDPATASLVKAVAEYKVDPVKAASSRNPKNAESERLKLIQLALQYDPTYDMTQFPAMSAARKDFSSGKASQNIRSLNTALKHLDEFHKAYVELGNWDVPIANAAGNFVTKNVGGKAVTNFNSVATAVSDELATLFKGTAGTDSAIAHWRESLDPNMSPAQFEGQMHTLLDLVGGRIAALDDQYRATTGLPENFEILSPTSKKILDKFGFKYANTQAKQAAPSGAAPSSDPLGLFKP